MDLINIAKRVIDIETDAVACLHHVIDSEFERAINLILNCKGRVVTTGMGKAGHIAKKIAATLASTGTPAFFMHPAEAIHGDLGMITANDIGLFFSHQGQTDEVLRIIPYFKHLKVPLIAITSNADSELARHSDISLILPIKREACPLDLAPTASTTAMLALGDTLALVLLEAHGFKQNDYALLHPGGSLGRRLLIKVEHLMHTGKDNPVVRDDTKLRDAILVMTSSKLAATSVIDQSGSLVGIFVDGDLRRYLMKGQVNLDEPITGLMTKNPKFATPDMMAVKALEILREYKIIELPVCDESHHPIGMIHLHDITRAGIT
ncbi:MAG: KpsF/GutQ family sugar-phosphate isomerase [Phycisphaerae bacterium]|jgi:arabinose-5-phosphate isomerase|nr:KpsF/GutQ family sugar-phosphate isomerase [Phycisphaerae bacterium]